MCKQRIRITLCFWNQNKSSDTNVYFFILINAHEHWSFAITSKNKGCDWKPFAKIHLMSLLEWICLIWSEILFLVNKLSILTWSLRCWRIWLRVHNFCLQWHSFLNICYNLYINLSHVLQDVYYFVHDKFLYKKNRFTILIAAYI